MIVCTVFSEANATFYWFQEKPLFLTLALESMTFKVVQEDTVDKVCFLSFSLRITWHIQTGRPKLENV